MTDYCFVTSSNQKYQHLADGLKNSIKKFYPDAPFFCHPYTDWIKGVGASYDFASDPGASYEFLVPYFETYKRVIFFNADFVMCSLCPKLFGDFELGIAYNDHNMGQDKRMVQNSLVVATNPQIFKDLTLLNTIYRKGNSPYYDMMSAQDLFYSGKYKTEALSYPDESYGIEEKPHYTQAYLKDKDIYVRDYANHEKKLCVIHFCYLDWKDTVTAQVAYERFVNPGVKERLLELASDTIS